LPEPFVVQKGTTAAGFAVPTGIVFDAARQEIVPMNRWRQLKQDLRSEGVFGTLKLFAEGYLKVNSFLVFYLDLTKPFAAPAPPPDIELRQGTLSDLQELRRGRTDLPTEFYCDEVFGFKVPMLAFVEGELAAIHWLVSPNEPSRFLSLSQGDVELNYNTVLPQFRGRRLAQLLMAFLISSARDAGHLRMFGVVNVQNVPQFKPMLDLNFRPVETLTHFAFRRPKATLKFVK
jgi:GNAT superfamily N-acetyltransferase